MSRRKPDPDSDTPGGQGDRLSRSEMKLVCKAVRQDWPISITRQKLLISSLFGFFDPKRKEPVKSRTQIAAIRAVAALSGLALKQQALDLAREKLDGKESDVSLAQLVAEAEERAEKRRKQRKK